VCPVPPARRVSQGPQGLRACPDRLAPRALPVRQVPPGPQASPARWAPKAMLAHSARKGFSVPKETRAPEVSREPWGPPVQRVLRESRAQRAIPAPPVRPAPLVQKVIQVPLAQPAL
jgi:hypothetical protein